MNKTLKASALIALILGGTALAGGGSAPAPRAPQPSAIAYRYSCDGGKSLTVRYIVSDPSLRRDPVFAVVSYGGQNYGLAPAVSASGTRYVGLTGPSTAQGLEWWEHQGEATLSSFAVNGSADDGQPLLRCKINL